MSTIRSLFSPHRPIDRQIEKVIDYYVQEDERLLQEINEYEITDNIEAAFRKFLEAYLEGVSGGNVPEIGIWVSGFYGSGKSSFTKYLGAALEPDKKVGDTPFLDLLCDRFARNEVPALLRSIAKKHPTAVIMLDLGAEQLVESTAESVTRVLYWKVLQWAGFSKEKKTAQLEFTLVRRGLYEKFKEEYKDRYKNEWKDIQNDPLLAVNRAAEIIPLILPEEFPSPDSYRKLKFEEARSVRDLSAEMIELVCNKTGLENIIFLIDEAGQYVAPRGELILDLDGLSRSMRELGRGKVWVVATAQQTLSEIVQKALYNSAELNRLKDRFPISITLDASDIREITYRRLLEKSEEGRKTLADLFIMHGQSLINHTRLNSTILYKSDPDVEQFTKLYPFLPQHFELLLELIRNLARSTGGLGLRSAIRVIQDVLVDKSKLLSEGNTKLADRDIGDLATVDHFYDILRGDINRDYSHVVNNIDKITEKFGTGAWETRVAKVVAVLQVLDNFPRNEVNIAALLYDRLGARQCQNEVNAALKNILEKPECGLIEDPQAGGYIFLSDAVRPVREERNAYIPSGSETLREEINLFKEGADDYPLFRSQPSARIENIKEVKASVKYGRNMVKSGGDELELRVEYSSPEQFQAKREDFLVASSSQSEYKNTIILLVERNSSIDDALIEIVKSIKATGLVDERNADRDLIQFIRAERVLADKTREAAAKLITKAFMGGVFIFRGKPKPVGECGSTFDTALKSILNEAGNIVFEKLNLAPIRTSTDLAAKFIQVDRLDRIPSELDPLKLVITSGTPRIDTDKAVLAEVIRVLRIKAAEDGTGRLLGSNVQDLFSSPPYGWTKDTIRYIFAALLRVGELEFHKPGADGAIRTAGNLAADAVKSTVEFNRIGLSLRDSRPDPEALDRAAKRLEKLFGDSVLPLEDRISQAVRQHVPGLLENIGSLPDRLRLLNLAGEERAARLLADMTDLLKGDAGDATSYLGGKDCHLPGEIEWGRKINDALESGAEEDIKNAGKFIKILEDIEALFPGHTQSLSSTEDLEIVDEILRSENFYEKLPELRRLIRNIEERIVNQFNIEVEKYTEELDAVVSTIEAHRIWGNLSEEERAEHLNQLKLSIPDKADHEMPGESLKLILHRSQMLFTRKEKVIKELNNKAEEIEKERLKVGDNGENGDEVLLTGMELFEPKLLESAADLDNWLSKIRGKIIEHLKNNYRVRVKL